MELNDDGLPDGHVPEGRLEPQDRQGAQNLHVQGGQGQQGQHGQVGQAQFGVPLNNEGGQGGNVGVEVGGNAGGEPGQPQDRPNSAQPAGGHQPGAPELGLDEEQRLALMLGQQQLQARRAAAATARRAAAAPPVQQQAPGVIRQIQVPQQGARVIRIAPAAARQMAEQVHDVGGGQGHPMMGAMAQPMGGAMAQPIMNAMAQPMMDVMAQPMMGAMAQPMMGAMGQPMMGATNQPPMMNMLAAGSTWQGPQQWAAASNWNWGASAFPPAMNFDNTSGLALESVVDVAEKRAKEASKWAFLNCPPEELRTCRDADENFLRSLEHDQNREGSKRLLASHLRQQNRGLHMLEDLLRTYRSFPVAEAATAVRQLYGGVQKAFSALYDSQKTPRTYAGGDFLAEACLKASNYSANRLVGQELRTLQMCQRETEAMNKRPRTDGSYSTGRYAAPPAARVVCTSCNKVGHPASKCFSRSASSGAKPVVRSRERKDKGPGAEDK